MSKIALPVAELKPALNGLAKVLSRKPTLPVLGHLRIERTRDGWIGLTTTDLDHYVTVRLEQPADGEPGVLLVPYDELLKITKACARTDTIYVEARGTASTHIQYPIGQQLAESKVDFFPAAEFPETPKVNATAITIPEMLRTSIHEAMECSSDDPTRFILQGAYLDVSEPKCHQVVGTDGRRLYCSNSFSLALEESLILPKHPFLAWKEFNCDGEWQLKAGHVGDDKDKLPIMQLSSRRWRFISRGIDGNYPNWRQVVPNEESFETRIELAADSLEQIIQTIQRMPCHDETHFVIGVEWSGRKLWLLGKSNGPDNWTKVEIPIAKGRGKEVTTFVNRKFLSKALSFGLNLLEIIDGMTPLRLTNGGRQVIIMPVRGDTADPATATATPAPGAEKKENEASAESPSPAPANHERKPAAASLAPAASPERNAMITDPTNTTPPADEQAAGSDLDQILEVIEDLRESLSTNLGDLKTVSGKLKQIKKEQKTTEREVQSFRQTLKTLQGVKL